MKRGIYMQKLIYIFILAVAFGFSACATAPTTETKAPSVKAPSVKAPLKTKAVPQKPINKIWVPGMWNESGAWVPGHWKAE